MAFFARQGIHGMAPRQRGGAAIEMMLIFPILVLLLYTIISYAFLFWAYQGLNSISADLAAQIMRHEWDLTDDATPINDAKDNLKAATSGPAQLASFCDDSPSIDQYVQGEEEYDVLSVCLEVSEGLAPQFSMNLPWIDITLPHLDRIEVTASVRLP